MKITKTLFWISVCLLLLTNAVYYFYWLENTKIHETLHAFIFDYYGCQNISIKVNWDGSGYTYAICNLTFDKWIDMEKLHFLNEIVTYNMNTFLMYFWTFSNIILTFLFILSLILAGYIEKDKSHK